MKIDIQKLVEVIGIDVTINQNNTKGTVRGIYIDKHKIISFYVEYIDANNAIFQKYFELDEVRGWETIVGLN